ncbi:Lysophospholipase NTE1, partial [Nosema bombycis CQ1]
EFLKRKDQSFNDLFFIHYGEIILRLETGEEFTFGEGDFVGFFNLFFDIFGLVEIFSNAKTKISIYEYDTLKRNGFNEEDFPFEIYNFPDFFRFVDVSCEWLILKPGIVFDQDCDNFYYVLDGECKGNKIYKEGMTINCEECLIQKKSNEKIKISKISNLIKIKKSLIEEFMRNNPKSIEIIRVLYNKNVNINSIGSIITILPADKQSNVQLFTRRLKGSIGKDCLLLGIREISEVLSKRVFTICEELRITDYLKRMTRVYPAVIVYLENEYSRFLKYLLKYSKTCLITGSLLKCPGELSKMVIYCEIEYVRLYEKRDYIKVGNNLKVENKVDNIKVMDKGHSKLDNNDKLNGEETIDNNTFDFNYKKISFNRVHHVVSPSRTVLFDTKDFERLGRFLLGKRIGLVLSGGGARGVAHIGVIQALEEEGIPIDIVGGTSMGAFIGALYARDCDNSHVFRDSKKFCNKARNIWPFLFDLTYPLIAFFTGRGINKTLKGIFKNFLIQDLWLEYFCITTNLFANDEEVHRSGLIWKYVRASMGICGYLPPVCDQRGFLVDGGYINNVPADVMLNMGVSLVLAVDIGTVYSNDYDHYGEYFDGFMALIHKYFGTRKYLTMEEIQYRIAFLTTEKKVKELESNPKILLMRPDLGDVKTGDFNKFDEIVAQGYQAGRAKIKEWKENGIYEKYFVNKKRTRRRYSV